MLVIGQTGGGAGTLGSAAGPLLQTLTSPTQDDRACILDFWASILYSSEEVATQCPSFIQPTVTPV